MLPARRGGWWDANKVGLSPLLIETPRGCLMVYYGVRVTAAGCLYRLGLALFDLETAERCLIGELLDWLRRHDTPVSVDQTSGGSATRFWLKEL